MGGYSRVYLEDDIFCRQFVSSSVSGEPESLYEDILNWFKFDDTIGERFRFDHKDWIRENNFGWVRTTVDGDPDVQYKLVSI